MGDFFGGLGGGDLGGMASSAGFGGDGSGDGSGDSGFGDQGGGGGQGQDQFTGNAYDTGAAAQNFTATPAGNVGTPQDPTFASQQQGGPPSPGSSPTGAPSQSPQQGLMDQLSNLLLGSPAQAATPAKPGGPAGSDAGATQALGTTQLPEIKVTPDQPTPGASGAPGAGAASAPPRFSPSQPYGTPKLSPYGAEPGGAPYYQFNQPPPMMAGGGGQPPAPPPTQGGGGGDIPLPQPRPDAAAAAEGAGGNMAFAGPPLHGATGSWDDTPPGVPPATIATGPSPPGTSTAAPGDQSGTAPGDQGKTPQQQAGYQDPQADQQKQQQQQQKGQQQQQKPQQGQGQPQQGQQSPTNQTQPTAPQQQQPAPQGQQQQGPDLGRIIRDIFTGNLGDLVQQFLGMGGQPGQAGGQPGAGTGAAPVSPQSAPPLGTNPPVTAPPTATAPAATPVKTVPEPGNAAPGAIPGSVPTTPTSALPMAPGSSAAARAPLSGGVYNGPQGGPQAGAPGYTNTAIPENVRQIATTPLTAGRGAGQVRYAAGGGRALNVGPPSQPNVDRSQFRNQINNNNIYKLAWMINGEVGRGAPLQAKIVQGETAFNRAQMRNDTLDHSLLSVGEGVHYRNRNGMNAGPYYARDTYKASTRPSQADLNLVRTQILPAILGGSNLSDIGHGPMNGNASAGVAQNQFRRGTMGYKMQGGDTYFREYPSRLPTMQNAPATAGATGPRSEVQTNTQVAQAGGGTPTPRPRPGAAGANLDYTNPVSNEAAQQNRWQQRTQPGGRDPGVVPAVGGYGNMVTPPTFQDRWEGMPYNPFDDFYRQLRQREQSNIG